MNYFGHSGDLGDVIWSLPTIKAAGGGTLHLINRPGRTTFPMTVERMDMIRPLLLQQPYITDVVFAGDDLTNDTDLNGFRDHCCCGRNLADAHLATHGMPFSLRNHPWLRVDSINFISPVVFVRSSRYNNNGFSWQRVMDAYGSQAVFLGTPYEHAEFVSKFGNVPYVRTPDLLAAARIIAAAQLFVGNQTCLHAIAEGLKQNIILEVCPTQANCLFNRMGVIDAWDDNFELPVLAPKPALESVAEVAVSLVFPGISEAYCINLRRRPDRWNLFQLRAGNSGFKFVKRFDGIDGSILNLPELLKSHKGTYGCLHSHAGIFRDALKRNHAYIMVVEDDCVFTCQITDMAEYLAATLGKFAWIHLDGSRTCYPRRLSSHSTHVQVTSVLNTHAYVIDKELMRHFVNYIDANPFPTSIFLHSDRLLQDLCERNSLPICIPPWPLAQQDKLISGDVQWGMPNVKTEDVVVTELAADSSAVPAI